PYKNRPDRSPVEWAGRGLRNFQKFSTAPANCRTKPPTAEPKKPPTAEPKTANCRPPKTANCRPKPPTAEPKTANGRTEKPPTAENKKMSTAAPRVRGQQAWGATRQSKVR